MYRVAVILNESELLRSGYANITPKLKSIDRFSRYTFESFTVVNITSLFRDGNDALRSFDSLIVSTNATSDRAVLESLRKNEKAIQDFLADGKGLFVCSQKKLSVAIPLTSENDGGTHFLPDHYEFQTVERPKVEADSGVGTISIPPDSENHLLLGHPVKITAQMVARKCEKNEFRRHCYRSHLSPKTKGAYIPLLKDVSYGDVPDRSLLMVGQSPLGGERVVISTIALDWEFHKELLTNIIAHVTEGSPKVAFIRKPDSRDGDYDFLLTSAALSKIPHSVYTDANAIPPSLLKVHDTYIFSPGWSGEEITAFLSKADSSQSQAENKSMPYRRVYYFQKLDGALTLTQYSTFSTIDLIIDRSTLWLASRFRGRMWGDSFWITHDVFFMLLANKIPFDSYIAPALRHIKEHYTNGSYDSVMGATCGLLELLNSLGNACPSIYQHGSFSAEAVKEICEWIHSNYQSQSANDKQTALLALDQIKTPGLRKPKLQEMFEEVFKDMKLSDLNEEDSTEIDVCRHIAICLRCDPSNQKRLRAMLANLHRRQSPEGQWTNTGRTAHVLVFLLENLDQLPKKEGRDSGEDCEEIIYKGILSLRSKYNWSTGNWDGDLQATAKAVHAIGMYNRRYKYSTQEFLKIIEGEAERMQSGTLVRELSERINRLLNEANEASVTIASLTQTNRHHMAMRKVEYAWRLGAVCSTILLVGVVGYFAIEDRQHLKDAIRSVAIISLLVGVVIALPLGWLIERVTKKRAITSADTARKETSK